MLESDPSIWPFFERVFRPWTVMIFSLAVRPSSPLREKVMIAGSPWPEHALANGQIEVSDFNIRVACGEAALASSPSSTSTAIAEDMAMTAPFVMQTSSACHRTTWQAVGWGLPHRSSARGRCAHGHSDTRPQDLAWAHAWRQRGGTRSIHAIHTLWERKPLPRSTACGNPCTFY